MSTSRQEHDALGSIELATEILHGIHTARALENFPVTQQTLHPELTKAYGAVKLACATTNQELGNWENDAKKATAIIQACQEMQDGLLNKHIVVDALQGGAGTSTNMNINEVLANRALELLNKMHGAYDVISPFDDINLHQSTNDTYPTALKIAAINLIQKLENNLIALITSFQDAEQRFAHIVKVGRTQLQDAVLTTLGREMAAYAEALGRDRWRLYKCQERLRVVNLGGTAIGTGLGAPKQYIFKVVNKLKEITNLNLARSENLIENTQNTDIFVEVSGLLKTCASNLLKIASDLRLMASGPEAGFAEITLPARQTGSSIMPGKVNPVIPEAVTQAVIMVIAYDQAITTACSLGNLELNSFLPLIAHCLLSSIDLLSNSCDILCRHCVTGITANEINLQQQVLNSTATITALIPALGYEQATEIVLQLQKTKHKNLKQIVVEEKKLLTAKEFEQLISPEAVCKLGY